MKYEVTCLCGDHACYRIGYAPLGAAYGAGFFCEKCLGSYVESLGRSAHLRIARLATVGLYDSDTLETLVAILQPRRGKEHDR